MNSEIRHGKYFENGRRFRCGGLNIAEMRGSWFQMGRQYGALMRTELNRVLEFARANPAGFSRLGQLGRDGAVTGLKRYDEWFRGVSESSGLSLDELRIVNSVEVIYLDKLVGEVREMFDGSRCSSLAVWGDYAAGTLLFGRNYDWLPEFEAIADTLTLAVFHPADGANAVATLNWAGCLYLTTGMNEQGLFLELNSGLYADPAVVPQRIHNVWLLWEFLLNSDRFEALEHAFATCRASAAYLIGAADSDHAECFQWPTREEYITAPREDGLLAFSNHFLTPDWPNSPDIAMTGCASSVRRCENLRQLAKSLHDAGRKIGPAELCALLDIPADEGGAKVKGSLFQAVVAPSEQTWYVKTRAMSDWAEIPLRNLLKGNGDLA